MEEQPQDEAPVSNAQPQHEPVAQEQVLATEAPSSHGSSGEGAGSAMARLISQEKTRRALPGSSGEDHAGSS